MDNEMQAALAGAVVGAVAGGFLALLAQEFINIRLRTRNARHLAIRVVCILDLYIEQCVEVAEDDGLSQGQRNEQGYLEVQVPTPDPPEFPRDLDWMSIDHALMYRILSLPNDAARANGRIAFIHNDIAHPPDYDEFFEAREEHYSKLGLEAAHLAAELRRKYGIPRPDLGEWNPVERLEKAKAEVEKFQEDRARRHQEMMERYERASGRRVN